MTPLSSEAERLSGVLEQWARDYAGTSYEEEMLNNSAALLRRIPELETERDKLAIQLNDLTALNKYVKERRAQISHRLWVWAHEELSEPLKTRYFNIVANGTADVMEQPTYAQQFNAMKYRAEASEAERDQLRAELEKVLVPDGWQLVAAKGFDDLMYWLDRCERKGHLENCCDLVEPWAAFDYREVSIPTPPNADQKGQ